MKVKIRKCNRNIAFTIMILINMLNISNAVSQGTPQFYNVIPNWLMNTFPFYADLINNPAIKNSIKNQFLLKPNIFTQPTPAPAGLIKKIYFQTFTNAYYSNIATFRNLTIKFGQTTDTNFTLGQYYSGHLDNVYFRDSVTIFPTPSAFIGFDLDNFFLYDPSKSLIIDIHMCGLPDGGFGIRLSQSIVGNYKRNLQFTLTCMDSLNVQDALYPILGIDFATTGITNIINEIPVEFSLKQNYPNPFNPLTNIEFSLSQTGHTELKVFNELGKEVSELLNEVMSEGIHLVQFDASALGSGVYYYRISSGKFIESKKMLLIK